MSLYYEESGNIDAPAIVFIHGGGISGWMWERQVAAFQDYHCIVPDLPEHGKSIDEKPITIADSADRIAQLIRNMASSGKAHVVGHSIGAKIIVELLSRHPDVIDHAVIVSALFRPIPFLKLSCNRFSYKLTVMMLKSKRLLGYQVKQFGFPGDDDRKNLARDFELLTPDSLDRIYGELFKHLKLPEHLSDACASSLVIAGTKELKGMRESVKDLVKVLPNAKGILFRGCRHDIPWKENDEFNQTIREWINDENLSSQAIQSMNDLN